MTGDLDPDEIQEIENILQELRDELRELEEGQRIPLAELFPAKFMQEHTDTSSIQDFLEQSDLFAPEDIAGGALNCTYCETGFESPGEVFNHQEFSRYVKEHTSFSSWEEMLTTAMRRWLARKLTPER